VQGLHHNCWFVDMTFKGSFAKKNLLNASNTQLECNSIQILSSHGNGWIYERKEPTQHQTPHTPCYHTLHTSAPNPHTLCSKLLTHYGIRLTHPIMYVPFRYPDFRKLFYLSFSANIQILSGGSDAPRSDPPHKIMRYWICYLTCLNRSFPPDQDGQAEMIRTGPVRYQLSKGKSVGMALKYLCMIRRVRRKLLTNCVTLYTLCAKLFTYSVHALLFRPRTGDWDHLRQRQWVFLEFMYICIYIYIYIYHTHKYLQPRGWLRTSTTPAPKRTQRASWRTQEEAQERDNPIFVKKRRKSQPNFWKKCHFWTSDKLNLWLEQAQRQMKL